MVYEMVYGDFFGLLFFTVRQTLDWTHLLSHFSLSIRTLNFLPNCSFCKQLKKSLRPCVQCKTVKYCDKVCQSNDWNHHQQICKRNSRGIWLLETSLLWLLMNLLKITAPFWPYKCNNSLLPSGISKFPDIYSAVELLYSNAFIN